MVNLQVQHQKIASEISEAIRNCIAESNFIGGSAVHKFEGELSAYLGNVNIISCGNGTDALQIALMALQLESGDEVIIPAFGYIAAAEAAALLGLNIVQADVCPHTFNITAANIEQKLTHNTRAVIVQHLFGQCADMQSIMALADKYQIYIIEDNAQSIGADVLMAENTWQKAGTIGHIGTTSFFPSKNLGAMGDGGAIFTHNTILAERIRAIANHGQSTKYKHDIVGINSRLDSLQAAILSVKLKHLNEYISARQKAAETYNSFLSDIKHIALPTLVHYSTHVFHQYTLRTTQREPLKTSLSAHGIPSMVYYPTTVGQQVAYSHINTNTPTSSLLVNEVISLPMHTELTTSEIENICNFIKKSFNNL